MSELVCRNCEHKNAAGTRFCQRCGQPLAAKKTLTDEVRSWKPQSLSGGTSKNTASGFASLFTLQTSDTVEQAGKPLTPSSTPVDPMPDGRWYCPDCGTLNTAADRTCKDCGKNR